MESGTKDRVITATESTEPVGVAAAGLLVMGGVGLFGLDCHFIGIGSSKPTVKFSSTGFGDVVDFGSSQLVGEFYGYPPEYVGKCHYSLEEVDDGAGEMELTLRKEGFAFGVFAGPAEGFGEALVANKKGHLHLEPSSHKNLVDLRGDASIKSIDFELDSEVISAGQPYHGTHWKWPDKKRNHLQIDVKCGRHGSSGANSPVPYFNAEASNNIAHCIGAVAGDLPGRLNFAIKGVLIIDGQRFDVSFAQGHTGARNPWYIASPQLVRRTAKKGYLGGFAIDCGSGYSTFKFKR